jgi:hypothetical protein
VKTRVITVICPKCGVEMYSRARHDARMCRCGTMIDGGFDYRHYAWPEGYHFLDTRVRYVNATRKQLYDDWSRGTNRFGIIKPKGEK